MVGMMRYLSSVMCAVLSFPALATFDFFVEQHEYKQISRMCQMYHYSVAGARLSFEVPYSTQELAVARTEAEDNGGAWHYCMGLVWLNRAATAPNDQERKFRYKMALNEINFTARKISPARPIYLEVQIHMARALYHNGSKDRSQNLLLKLIREYPAATAARIELASQYRKAKNTAKAIEVLEQATQAEFERSADLNYFLGVYHFHEGDLASAKKYADQAYKLGYPLPWLKNKLAQKGIK